MAKELTQKQYTILAAIVGAVKFTHSPHTFICSHGEYVILRVQINLAGDGLTHIIVLSDKDSIVTSMNEEEDIFDIVQRFERKILR